MTSVAITIDIAKANATTLPAALEQRLSGSPSKSPDELANELRAHQSRTEKLRTAHLDAVRDRAARESQRAAEAAMRKLRLAASRAALVQRKVDEADERRQAKREMTDAQREARKAKRAQMAQAVAEARRTAIEAREARQVQLLEAGKQAFAKHARLIQEIADKSAWQVRHAVAVVAAQKEKERLSAEAASERLAGKLERAAESRAATSPHTSRTASPVRRLRVLNDAKVASERKRLVFDERCSKAASNREALLSATAQKAGAENARAACVAAANHAKKSGTDVATAEAKAAHYAKLLRAEVARLSHLKQKFAKANGDTVSVIVVRTDAARPRMPPEALARRLSQVNRTLLATAASRQARAASKRCALRAAAALKQTNANQRRANALVRIGAARAVVEAKVKAKAARAVIAAALVEGRHLHARSEASARDARAHMRRASADKALLAKADAMQAKGTAANERRGAKLQAKAKPGVCAVRAAAFHARRDAQSEAAVARLQAKAKRCALATALRDDLLAQRVARARLRMTAPHAKREVADMEIEAQTPEA